MKNTFKYLAALAMSIALTGLTACDPEPTPDPTPDPTTESSLYAFQYDGQIVAAGGTIYYTPTLQQVNNDQAMVDFFMVNKTEENLPTVMKVEVVSGPEALNDLEICYDGLCRNYTCPWTSGELILVPGVNTDLKMTLDYHPSDINGITSVYRITIGKGANMEQPQVMYLDITGE